MVSQVSSLTFFSKFNDNVNTRYEEVVTLIERDTEEMYKEGGIGGLAMQRAALFKVDKIGEGMGYMNKTISLLEAEI
jgi:hypothetical protein